MGLKALISLEMRGCMAAGKDLFLSMHSDATPGTLPDPVPRGMTVYRSVRQPQSAPFSDRLGAAVAAVMRTPYRGGIARPYPGDERSDYYAVLRSSVCAGVGTAFLMEHGFHTNPQDCAALMDDDILRQIAQAEVAVIAAWYGFGPAYTVRAGDTLYAIGRRFGVDWRLIAIINGIGEPYRIFPRQVLMIPST